MFSDANIAKNYIHNCIFKDQCNLFSQEICAIVSLEAK